MPDDQRTGISSSTEVLMEMNNTSAPRRNKSKCIRALVGPGQLRQVFNDTDDEVLWLIVGAPEELQFLPGSKPRMDLPLIHPVDPKQLPKELAGVQWPPKE